MFSTLWKTNVMFGLNFKLSSAIALNFHKAVKLVVVDFLTGAQDYGDRTTTGLPESG